ncbi:MAG TPA: LpxD N-terminal domain-containing protein, partial [Terriglobus sp.]
MATIAEIVEWIGGETASPSLRGSITRVSALEGATADAAVFASSEDVLRAALQSTAGLILVASKLTSDDPRIVRVNDPRLAFSVVADRLRPAVAASVDVTAVIHPTAHIGEGSSIGPGAVIGAGVRMGTGCLIGPRVVIEDGVVIGDRVRIQAGAV